MERFYLITNRAKDPDLTVTDQIRQYLEERGKTCLLCDNSEKGEKYHYTDPAQVPSDIDGILVLGGDGTLLQAAGDVVDLQIPLLGINLGTLGYLAEIDRDTLYPALDHLMADEYTIEHRMMLCGSIYRDGKLIAEDAALNDITITREGNLRVVRFDNYVNGEFLNSYSADGIIIDRLQPLRGRPDHLTVGKPDADDAACPAHPEYEKHCLPGRGCDRGGARAFERRRH
mgnify:CR=1 FL=1